MNKQIENIKGNQPIAADEFDDTMTSLSDCRNLWAAKLLAYMHDAFQPRQSGSNLPPVIAQGWFGTFDFRETCWCAGLHHRDVMRAYETRLALAKEGRCDEALEGLVHKGRTKK